MTKSLDVDDLKADVKEAAQRVKGVIDKGGKILVVSHSGDTDGETGGAIALKGISRAYGFDKPYLWDNRDGSFEVKGTQGKIDYMPASYNPDSVDKIVEMANTGQYDMVLAFDWGSGLLRSLGKIDNKVSVILGDHHTQDISEKERQKPEYQNILEINPNRYGLDEGKDACGASLSYLVAKGIDPRNKDLAGLAVIGAKGDMQDFKRDGLEGDIYKEIVADAGSSTGSNKVTAETGFIVYGRDTVELPKQLLTYYNRSGPLTRALVANHNLDSDISRRRLLTAFGKIMKDDWGMDVTDKTLSQLSDKEQKEMFDHVYKELTTSGYKLDRARFDDEITGTVYTLDNQPEGTKWHNASEYSTITSACSKMGEHATAINALLDHKQSRDRAENTVYKGYKREIGRALGQVKYEDRDAIRVADASGHRATITGILAGIYVDDDFEKPMVSVVYSKLPGGGYKGSVRRPVDSPLSCSDMCRIAETYGGEGGGHPFAAGFFAPDEKALGSILTDMEAYAKQGGGSYAASSPGASLKHYEQFVMPGSLSLSGRDNHIQIEAPGEGYQTG